jgi:hypothetical protein
VRRNGAYTHLTRGAYVKCDSNFDRRLREDLRLQANQFIAENPCSFVAWLRQRLIKEGEEHWWATEGKHLDCAVAGFWCSIQQALEN